VTFAFFRTLFSMTINFHYSYFICQRPGIAKRNARIGRFLLDRPNGAQ